MALKFKIILAGDGGVGKTSLINRFVTGMFADHYKATIGVSINTKRCVVDGTKVQLQIWDVAGQSLFRHLRKNYFARAGGALLVFDLTNPQTLEDLHSSWIDDIQEQTDDIPLILLANKVDLTNMVVVLEENIVNFREKNPGVVAHFSTSAKMGDNVETAFNQLISTMLKQVS